jgi:hypothetical protein
MRRGTCKLSRARRRKRVKVALDRSWTDSYGKQAQTVGRCRKVKEQVGAGSRRKPAGQEGGGLAFTRLRLWVRVPQRPLPAERDRVNQTLVAICGLCKLATYAWLRPLRVVDTHSGQDECPWCAMPDFEDVDAVERLIVRHSRNGQGRARAELPALRPD